jgi:signal transduction histidine kinase
MRVPPLRSSTALLALILPACVLLAAVVDSARRAVAMPFPSVLIATDGGFATFFLPSWGTAHLPIRNGDPVLAVDGVAVSSRRGALPGPVAYALMADAWRAGRRTVTVEYRHHGARRRQVFPLRTIGAPEVWFFAVLMPLAACLYLASGLMAQRLTRRHPAGRAYLLWCVAIFVILATAFDYVTLARLQPVFPLGMMLVGLACVWAAYTFPQAPASPWLRRAMSAFTVAFGALMAWAAVTAFAAEQSAMRLAMNVVGVVGVVALAVIVVARLWLVPAEQRASILAVTWILVPVPLFCSALLAGLVYGNGVLTWALPFVFLLVPLTVDYALLRQSAADTTRAVDRRVLVVPSTLWAILWGLTMGWLTRALDIVPQMPVAVPAAVAMGVSVTVFALQKRLADRIYFSPAARFRPTVVQLGDALATLTDRRAILATLEAHVTRWLGVEGARVLEPDEFVERTSDVDLEGARTASERPLRVPMRCQGELQGALQVPARPRSTPYSHDDLVLLDTVAGLGALALHHARVVSELEALRRVEVGASRSDRELAVGSLSSEVCHEVAYSLHYFRFLLGRVSAGKALVDTDVELGREEVERLERMIASLRRAEVAQPRRVELRLIEPIARAFSILREQAQGRGVEIEVPDDLTVYADRDALMQVFANLLRNALQAADGGRVGVRAAQGPDGVTVDVWDTGPGVPAALTSTIFTPWVTTKKQGLGLGLAITERLVRSLGWAISLHREGDTTVFRVRAPSRSTTDAHDDRGASP